jgi:hypothetical protein
MKSLSKKQKRHLRELTALAYERDLARSLDALTKEVDAWREGRCSAWDLNQKVHEYHDQTARSLYKIYTSTEPFATTALAITRGVLALDEVDESLRDEVKKLSEALKGS